MPRITHLEILVEERSMHVALGNLLPKIVPTVTFEIRVFDGKHNLLRKLESRLRGYSSYIRDSRTAVVVVIDEDRQDCMKLKEQIEAAASASGLLTLSTGGPSDALVVNRMAVEELESWFFGDAEAIRSAYPRVSRSLEKEKPFRDADAVAGGTAEALERVLSRAGHIDPPMRKTAVAGNISKHMNVENNTSGSFAAFRDGIRLLVDLEGVS